MGIARAVNLREVRERTDMETSSEGHLVRDRPHPGDRGQAGAGAPPCVEIPSAQRMRRVLISPRGYHRRCRVTYVSPLAARARGLVPRRRATIGNARTTPRYDR